MKRLMFIIIVIEIIFGFSFISCKGFVRLIVTGKLLLLIVVH